MMYVPNPKALVYNEINFISTSVPFTAKISMDVIFDEVSRDIFALFVGPVEEVVAESTVSQLIYGTEILN